MRVPAAARFAALATAGVVVVVTAAATLAWFMLEPEARAALARAVPDRGSLAFAGVLALGLAALLLYGLAWLRLGFVPRLVHALEVLGGANPGLRLGPEDDVPDEVARAVNALASGHEARRRAVEGRVAEATAVLEHERDLLAAVLARADEPMLVCAMDGRILLYNRSARDLLAQALEDGAGLGLGLGRSIFGLFRRSVIVHGLERMSDAQARGEAHPAAAALISTRRGLVLRARFTPLRAERSDGFFLTLADVTAAVAGPGGERGPDLIEGARAHLANARAAIEVLAAFPDLASEQRQRFVRILDEETGALSHAFEQAQRDSARAASAAWTLEEIPGDTLLQLLRRRLDEIAGMQVGISLQGPPVWVKADTYALAAAIGFVASQLRAVYTPDALNLRLGGQNGHVALDLAWSGAALLPAPLWRFWTESAVVAGTETLPFSVVDVVHRHGGEVWQQTEPGQVFVRLLLPAVQTPAAPAAARAVTPSRPEFSAFNLFERGALPAATRETRLRDLMATAFDTETTGLDPSAGDQIIAIGAIHVVKGRILSAEVFESLAASQRPIAPEARRVHGITAEMLRGQPPLTEVLSRFHRFCEDGVLIGHNAAFDLRFLELQQPATGIAFRQPVLDTLLLSAAIYPERDAHQLEAIAQRLGVSVIGRHTALGDAILTAEVFVRLLPLLESKGITTLAEALAASERTYHARLRY